MTSLEHLVNRVLNQVAEGLEHRRKSQFRGSDAVRVDDYFVQFTPEEANLIMSQYGNKVVAK